MKKHSYFRDLTRGGQITLHGIRMFLQVLRYGLFSTLICFLLCFGYIFSQKVHLYDLYILGQTVEAHLKLKLLDKAVKHQVRNPTGTVVELSARDFVRTPKVAFHLKRCQAALGIALRQSAGYSLGLLLLFVLYFRYTGRLHRQQTQVSGETRVQPMVLAKRLHQQKKASDFQLAGVPLVKDAEVQHLLLSGTTGTGKSVCMQELMDQVRAKGQRAIVYDIDGAFIPHYYRPKKDILLNPLDERSPIWNIWQECLDPADFESAAHSLMPLHLAGTDPFWIHSAHTIFASAALKLKQLGQTQTRFLVEPMFGEDLGSLAKLLANTPAESLVSEKNEKTALSIKATLSTYCKSLLYLKPDTHGPLFSIRRWIEADRGDGWLFIASNAQKIEALKPLISVWLEVAAKSVLSLSPSHERRLWFFMDELPTLHRLPSLMPTLSRGRKYGVCFVTSLQDVHQLHAIYGRNDAESLSALFNTKVFYRSQEPDSAAWMSRVMGGLELLELKEGFSYGAHEMRDGVSIHQERRREPVVRESEFLGLPDLEAFLRLPGQWPVTKLSFKLQTREVIAKAFVPRKNLETIAPAVLERPTSDKTQKLKQKNRERPQKLEAPEVR